jgi:hypothetical protein
MSALQQDILFISPYLLAPEQAAHAKKLIVSACGDAAHVPIDAVMLSLRPD